MATTLTGKTAAQFRDDALRTQKNGMALVVGVPNFNISKGSEPYQFFNALGLELEAVSNNTTIAADAQCPDTASGADLDRQMAIVGLARRGAGPSTGHGVFSTSAATGVPLGSQLLAPNGAIYTVTTGGVYASGDSIPLQSSTFGLNTNLSGGTVLRWVSPPAFAAPTMALDVNGMEDGVDAEDDDTARARLLDRYQNPPSGGNSADFAETCEAADVAIQKAFVYPACNGPGTTHVAVCGYASSSSSRSRAVAPAVVAAATSAAVAAFPECAEIVVTGTQDLAMAVTFTLRLPAPTTAIPAGAGGGFIDANPWPSVAGILSTRIYCRALVVTNPTALRVESMTAPVVGQSISWIDTVSFTLHTAKIVTAALAVAVAGTTPGQWDITIDTAFSASNGATIPAGSFIFPAAANTQAYLTACLDWFAGLGPYEKTTATGLLPHAYRQPRFFESWDYTIGPKAVRAITDAGSEVLDASLSYPSSGTVPDLPVLISDGPFVFTPQYLAFYSA